MIKVFHDPQGHNVSEIRTIIKTQTLNEFTVT